MSCRSPSTANGTLRREKHFPLRLFLPRAPKGRFQTNGAGLPEDVWKIVTAFEICEGRKGGLIAMYDSNRRPQQEIRELLRELEYTDFLASGTVDASQRQLRFQQPDDVQRCKDWLIDATNDTEFLRFFGNFQAFGPSGDTFGVVGTFCTRI